MQDAVKSVERGPLLRHVAMVQGHVQAVQRFGYLLSTLQQDLDKLQDAPGAAARISQLLLTLVARERRVRPSASTGDRAEKFRALEALLVSYGASAMGAATHGPAAGMVSVCPSSSTASGASSSSSPASSTVVLVEDRAWLRRRWEALRCYMLVPLFGADDEGVAGADSQMSADSVEITGEIMVQQGGVWRLATDTEREQIQGRDALEKELDDEQEREDEERGRDLQESRKSQAAQAWHRQALQDAMQMETPKKRMRLHFRLRDRHGCLLAEGSSEVAAEASAVHSTETWLSEQENQDGLRDTEEPNVGTVEFDQLVVESSQQLPEAVAEPEPPQLEGHDSAVIAAYLAMYVDGSLPDETIEDRFGPAALQLFRARRHVDDPAAWHVFRQWAKGEVTDDDVTREHGPDFMVALRNELDLQGGATPVGPNAADSQDDGIGGEGENLAEAPFQVERGQEGGETSDLWNTEDAADIGATRLFDSREGMEESAAHASNSLVVASVAGAPPQAVVDGGPPPGCSLAAGPPPGCSLAADLLSGRDSVPGGSVGGESGNMKEVRNGPN